jgi:DNA polymerase-4
MKTILHVDMNCFFPSVEEILNPKLKNKPVVVGGRTKRSVVASANYEARRYGIKAAMPLYRASILCPKAIIVEPHFREYERYHNLFINLLKEKITDKIEVASIDECYIDITSLIKKQSAKSIAIKIQNLLKSKLNLGSSIGIGHNRFMSKMGSNYKKPLGITQMFNEDLISKI